ETRTAHDCHVRPWCTRRGLGTVVFSEQSTEEDLPMLRLRLASLALATGFLVTLSGCMSTSTSCNDGGCRIFQRLFNRTSNRGPTGHGDCECQGGMLPFMLEPAVQGPIRPGPTATGPGAPIIRNMPPGQPQVFK